MISPNDPQLRHLLSLIRRARGCEFSSRGGALAFLRASGVGPTADLVLSAMWELRGDWESGLLALQWGEERVVSCLGAWHLLVWAAAKEGRFDVAWSVIRRMHRRKIPVRRALLIVMERYVACEKIDKAIKTFHAMERFDIYADSDALYSLLHFLCKNKYVEEAEELLFLDRKMFPLETNGFNVILNGWCNVLEDLGEAKRVWREMSVCCVCPNKVSYSHMIRCSSKVGTMYDSLRLYDEMKRKGWVPDLAIYNSLVYVLTRENCLNNALAILHMMKETGLQANADTYNSIILPLCELGKLEEAHRILKEMTENTLEPTVETFHAFAMAEGVDGTLALIEKMRTLGCGPSKETFLIIFNKFFRLDQPDNALRLWVHMRRYGIIPDSELYYDVVNGLFSCKWFSKAQEFYKEMISKGFSPDPRCNKLLKVWKASLGVRTAQRDEQVNNSQVQ